MTLATAATGFISAYHARADLVADHQDWSLMIVIVATDSGETLSLQVEQGRIVALHEHALPGTLVITSDSTTLREILEFRLNPNEPYVFGDLTVQGAEADFLRLDYIVTVLCPS